MILGTTTTAIPRKTTTDSQPSLKHTEHSNTVASITETETTPTSSVFITSSDVDSHALSNGQTCVWIFRSLLSISCWVNDDASFNTL